MEGKCTARFHRMTAVFCLGLLFVGGIGLYARAGLSGGKTAPDAPALGAYYDKSAQSVTFAVYSSRATRIDLCLYDQASGADEKARVGLKKDSNTNVWSVARSVAELADMGIKDPIYYG